MRQPSRRAYKPGDKVRESGRKEILTVEGTDVKQDDEGDGSWNRDIVNFTDGTYAYLDEVSPA